MYDDYGYKATCSCCGSEIILDSSNAPGSVYRENNKTSDSTTKSGKKGKVALKVALGVVTGGVSLIPDAVSAVKRNNTKK